MKKTNKEYSMFDILKTIFIAIIVSFIVLCFIRLTIVQGQSMENTFVENEKLILSKTSYLFHEVERGDIIVVTPKNINVDYIIKRVIAIPGDTIEIKDNEVYVNDERLEESYLKDEMITADIEKFKLANNEYFICGDNRNNSLDSRSEILGPITKSEIFGKVVLSLNKFKFY